MGSTFKWSSESEIELFLLLGGRRPIGKTELITSTPLDSSVNIV